MLTVYHLALEDQGIDLEYDQFRAALPSTIDLKLQPDGYYATVETTGPDDSDAQQLIDRELDRIFFLTNVRLCAVACPTIGTVELKLVVRVLGGIPRGTCPQQWTDHLALQLRLWAMAVDSTDPYVRILLFFQIIELSYPTDTSDKTAYPKYNGAFLHPRTEAKLLRHLVAHAGNATTHQTRKYLEFLGLPPCLSNLVHPDWRRVISKKVAHVEAQAHSVLKSALQPFSMDLSQIKETD
ncbi:hypothetical protein [Sulfuriferula multivorans]|uniref:hypothetical protein n=1 Tax=Sulfuriferula multivorans TaxID=1559896 RepID=UPI000F5BE03C|nr:hypothetical protein [Sulfuriferula multivorans]